MANREFTLVRTVDAPQHDVFRAWTDPAHLDWLFNPAYSADEATTVDLRVGGQWRQRMIIDESYNYMTGGIYRAVEPISRIVFAWGAIDGWPEIDPDDLDAGPIATVTLEAIDDETTAMTLHLQVPEARWHPAMQDGWSDTIDRLVAVYA